MEGNVAKDQEHALHIIGVRDDASDIPPAFW